MRVPLFCEACDEPGGHIEAFEVSFGIDSEAQDITFEATCKCGHQGTQSFKYLAKLAGEEHDRAKNQTTLFEEASVEAQGA